VTDDRSSEPLQWYTSVSEKCFVEVFICVEELLKVSSALYRVMCYCRRDEGCTWTISIGCLSVLSIRCRFFAQFDLNCRQPVIFRLCPFSQCPGEFGHC